MPLHLIFWDGEIVSRAQMVWTKPAVFFLWLGGNKLYCKNEPSSLSWEQGPFHPLTLSSLAQLTALLVDSKCKTKLALLAWFGSTQLGGKDSECMFTSVKLICRC